jgi:hypothetical protein
MPDELQRWLEQTVLPRKAPWIGSADDPANSAAPPAGRQGAAGLIGSGRRPEPAPLAPQRPTPAPLPRARSLDIQAEPTPADSHRLWPRVRCAGWPRRSSPPTPENYARAYARSESGQPPPNWPAPWRPQTTAAALDRG